MSVFLTKEFFFQPAIEVAPRLLGQLLCRQLPSGEAIKSIIVETEAYMPSDPACHAYRGPSKRNLSMFLEGGVSYVYLIYGMHYCLNVVTGKKGNGQGVLIRALDIIGQENPAIAAGPGKLCRYLQINKEQNGILFAPENKLWFEENPQKTTFPIATSPRVGISQGTDKFWRFFIQDHPAVSCRRLKQALPWLFDKPD
jgi:DNA-3-methyladenine glycosylase